MDIQLSGLQFDMKNMLNPLTITRLTGSEQEMFCNYPVPTYISTCPHCFHNNKWATTGLIAPITCKSCNKQYRMFVDVY